MNNTTLASCNINPFQYQPYQIPITRHILSDGTFEYRQPNTNQIIKVNERYFSDVFGYCLERFRVLVDMLPEADYSRFGYLFTALIHEATNTLHETDHYIRKNIGDIKLSVISHDQYPYRTDSIIDAKIEEEEI